MIDQKETTNPEVIHVIFLKNSHLFIRCQLENKGINDDNCPKSQVFSVEAIECHYKNNQKGVR